MPNTNLKSESWYQIRFSRWIDIRFAASQLAAPEVDFFGRYWPKTINSGVPGASASEYMNTQSSRVNLRAVLPVVILCYDKITRYIAEETPICLSYNHALDGHVKINAINGVCPPVWDQKCHAGRVSHVIIEASWFEICLVPLVFVQCFWNFLII